MSVLVIVATLVALMVFAYRGVSVLVLAPLLAMAAALLTGELPAMHALSGVYMPAGARYIERYFPVFLCGAIFGKLMGASGAAHALSQAITTRLGTERAVLAIVVATALLTYGGVSLFVVVFAMEPIGASILRAADIPKRLLPACITLGAFTFTMTALPGSPQYLNTMPTIPFGTDIYAAPVLGLFAAAVILGLGLAWITSRAARARRAGEGYGLHPDEGAGYAGEVPGVALAMAPIGIVFVVNFVLTNVYFKRPDVVAAYEAAGTQVNGTWPVILGLGLAIVFLLVAMRRTLARPNHEVTAGAIGALLPIFNTASEVGYGAVVTSLAAFAVVKAGLASLAVPALYKVAITASALAGIVGSSSGGTAMVLDMLGAEFLATGTDPAVLHRVVLLAAGGLDTLPHCGAVITLLAVCKLTHRESYGDVAMVSMGIPLVAVGLTILLHQLTGLV